jgi:hypothetical protein
MISRVLLGCNSLPAGASKGLVGISAPCNTFQVSLILFVIPFLIFFFLVYNEGVFANENKYRSRAKDWMIYFHQTNWKDEIYFSRTKTSIYLDGHNKGKELRLDVIYFSFF